MKTKQILKDGAVKTGMALKKGAVSVIDKLQNTSLNQKQVGRDKTIIRVAHTTNV